MMRLLIYPGFTASPQLGAERYEVEWFTLRPDLAATWKHGDEVDFDSDLVVHREHFKVQALALAFAEKYRADHDDLFFGVLTVQKQRIDWFVQEDGITEWADIGDEAEVS